MNFNFLPAWPPALTPLMAFGVMLMIGALGGFFAHRLRWLPSITGFLLVGYVCGPDVFDLLRRDVIYESQVIVDIALALILYRLGLSLDLKALRESPKLVIISLLESAATFFLVATTLWLFDIPPLIAALVAAITISSSPAVLLHVAHEVGARGEVTDSTQTLVVLNNLISFMIFTAILPLLHLSSGSDWVTITMQPLYPLAGSIVLGALMAMVLHQVAVSTRHAPQYRLALVIGTIMVTLGLALQLKLSPLLAPLIIGVAVKNIERKNLVSKLEFGPSFELFFIVLFVFAGASLHLGELIEYLPAVLALVLVRFLAKTVFVSLLTKLYFSSLRNGIASGLLLTPMAGLAIGLVHASGTLFPQYAALISAIVLGSVTVFETIGPPLSAFAYRFAREAHEFSDDDNAQPVDGETPASADGAAQVEVLLVNNDNSDNKQA